MEGTDPTDDIVARNRDVRIRGVLLFGFWLAVGAIAVQLAMWVLFRGLEKSTRAEDKKLSPMVAASLKRTPPEPRLESIPLEPRLKVRAEEDRVLNSYAWVDQKAGVVRISIDRAMELLVERGLPSAKPMTATASVPAQPAERSR